MWVERGGRRGNCAVIGAHTWTATLRTYPQYMGYALNPAPPAPHPVDCVWREKHLVTYAAGTGSKAKACQLQITDRTFQQIGLMFGNEKKHTNN
ncbi:hypothetical protein ILYODFUR_036027 [Ilyodon furcidens]|uniref:Uncharacterized protein n=1 Tax=Ilyodon furcidens TaxID=33524 RepID=A0ABV0V9N6_9TELE